MYEGAVSSVGSETANSIGLRVRSKAPILALSCPSISFEKGNKLLSFRLKKSPPVYALAFSWI